ncbi:MAG: adenosylmethionine--8-amino-7-oxononanoate transaminase [Deltaproteobacteria bacterium]|nr:adenosylmethionine--8-amino-7-oxononanoate transaminase [Deltaproteobacteria bacterium]
MSELSDLDRRVLWHPFTQQAEWTPLVIAGGDGSFLIDEHGKRYIDGVSSLWCNVHGHRHPALDRALADQASKLAHSTFLGLTHEPGIRLAAALIDVAPKGLTRVFYSDSGSTAVEIALKQSFQYWQLRGRSAKQKFVRLGDAYHGDTLGAVGVGGIDLFHRVFGPLLVQSIAIPSPSGSDGAASLEQLERELSNRAYEIAALVVEPLVQGAAGMLVHPSGFLGKAAELCRHYSVHLIVDEVATGFGRTGTMFACEQEDVTPDFLCLAKGIAAGYLPLAATLSTEEIYSAFLGKRTDLRHFFHGHTFTANPLACAVGLASLDLLQRETLPNAQRQIHAMTAALSHIARLPGVRDVRQCGLMAGIELAPMEGRALGVEVCDRIRSHGVILRNLGDVVVWMPPLSISTPELQRLETATSAAIGETLG